MGGARGYRPRHRVTIGRHGRFGPTQGPLGSRNWTCAAPDRVFRGRAPVQNPTLPLFPHFAHGMLSAVHIGHTKGNDLQRADRFSWGIILGTKGMNQADPGHLSIIVNPLTKTQRHSKSITILTTAPGQNSWSTLGLPTPTQSAKSSVPRSLGLQIAARWLRSTTAGTASNVAMSGECALASCSWFPPRRSAQSAYIAVRGPALRGV